MGFYFRKSVNLGGLRFNLSKSGVGVSTGFKGFRIGSGPRGNYVQMGRNGIYYKKTWENYKGENKHNNTQNIKKCNQNNYMLKSDNEDLDEYSTEKICDSSSIELNEEINIKMENGNENISAEYENNEADPCLMEAIDIVIETGQASTSFIQRRFKVGYARAGRIIDQMEERGIISEYQGSKPREVLMTKERWMQLKNKKVDNSAVEQTKEEKKEDIEEKIEIKDKKKNMFYKK